MSSVQLSEAHEKSVGPRCTILDLVPSSLHWQSERKAREIRNFTRYLHTHESNPESKMLLSSKIRTRLVSSLYSAWTCNTASLSLAVILAVTRHATLYTLSPNIRRNMAISFVCHRPPTRRPNLNVTDTPSNERKHLFPTFSFFHPRSGFAQCTMSVALLANGRRPSLTSRRTTFRNLTPGRNK